MEGKRTLMLDPNNPEHQKMIRNMLAVRANPIVSRDSLETGRQPMQKILSPADVENIQRAEAKRARKAAKL